MKVVFRVDASQWIGTGHVMRCLVLADELKKYDYSVFFACLPLQGDLISYIQERSFNVIKLSTQPAVIPRNNSDYDNWLPRSFLEDALDFIACVKSADVVITDHYAIETGWQKIVKEKLNCHLVAIDDLVRVHCADLIVDHTLGRLSHEYHTPSLVLAGTDYAILAPDFYVLREQSFLRKPPENISRVLISMGGIDNLNATLAVLKALVGNVNATFTVLLSAKSPHYQAVKQWCEQHDCKHKSFERNMAGLMLEHDIAIGAPGITSWERACMGLPSILIPLADNQLTNCSRLLSHRAIIKVSLADIEAKLLAAYRQLHNDWHEYYRNNLKLCDGLGARRIVLEINQLHNNDATRPALLLRRANDNDIETLFIWQCHPKTRKFALNSQIPSWKEHYHWMKKKLESFQDFFYIIVDKKTETKLGVFRLDYIQQGQYLISLSVEPESFGQHIATQALNIALKLHRDVTMHAKVLRNNIASQRLFQNANFIQIDAETFIHHAV